MFAGSGRNAACAAQLLLLTLALHVYAVEQAALVVVMVTTKSSPASCPGWAVAACKQHQARSMHVNHSNRYETTSSPVMVETGGTLQKRTSCMSCYCATLQALKDACRRQALLRICVCLGATWYRYASCT